MTDLFRIAEENGVRIVTGNIPETKSIAIPGAVCLDRALCFDRAEERTRLSHELGHNLTWSFYRRDDPPYWKRRMENRANRWSIRNLVSEEELYQAIRQGYTETWELAEYFDVTEDFIKMALWYYHCGNLAM